MRLKHLLILIVMLSVTGVAAAGTLMRASQCTVESDEVLTGNVFALCQQLRIDGRIDGNLIGGAFETVIGETGEINGNVYLLGGQTTVAGRVGKNLHTANVALNVLSTAQFDESDVLTAGLSSTFAPEVQIPGSLIGLGYQSVIQGEVGQNVDYWGSALVIEGRVRGNVDANVGDARSDDVASSLQTLLIPFSFNISLVDPGLTFHESGIVDGNLLYRAPSRGIEEGSAGSLQFVYEPTEPTLLEMVEDETPLAALGAYLAQVFREFSTLGLIGLAGLLLIPQTVQTPIQPLRRQPLASLGVGLLSFILSFPIVLILLVLSLLLLGVLAILRLDGVIVAVGIVLGLVNIGGATLFYFVAIFIARTIFALAIGRLVVYNLTRSRTLRSWLFSLAVGALLVGMIGSLPVIGALFNAFALFLGLGAILTVIQNRLQSVRDEAAPSAVYYPYVPSASALPIPPPALEETNMPRGMDNLPEGFTWWED